MVVKYPLKGIFKTQAKGRTYWYAWRGPPLGPRLHGLPGSPEFHASYVEAHAALRAPDAGRFRSLVVAYRASSDYQTLAPSTKQDWARWLDRIDEHFGDLRIEQFERTVKIRPIIIRWRSQWADKPRTATFPSRCSRASCRMPPTRSESSRAIPVRASRRSTEWTVRNSSGPQPTSTG